jgi:glycerate 2-kinase
LEDVDLVITGEGKFDDQTLSGKVVKGVIDRCSHKSKPVVVVSAIVEAKRLSWEDHQVKVV